MKPHNQVPPLIRILTVCAIAFMLVTSLTSCDEKDKIMITNVKDHGTWVAVDFNVESTQTTATLFVLCSLVPKDPGNKYAPESSLTMVTTSNKKGRATATIQYNNIATYKKTYAVTCKFNDEQDSDTKPITLSAAPTSCTPCTTCSPQNSLPQGGGPQLVLASVDCPPTPTEAPIEQPTPTDTPTPQPTPSFNWDQSFDRPQYLIHITGHGTVDGSVTDDAYILYIEEPDAQGIFREADGYGGTITYSSDFHTGPLTTPRSVCEAAAARGLPAQQWTPYNRTDSFDCGLLTS
jgi:hypothetical protein